MRMRNQLNKNNIYILVRTYSGNKNEKLFKGIILIKFLNIM